LNGDSANIGLTDDSSGDDRQSARAERARVSGSTAVSRGPASGPEEITVRDLHGLFSRAKWQIVGITAAVTIAVTAMSYLMPKEYQTTALVAAVTANSSSGGGRLGSLSSELSDEVGGIASLVGLTSESDMEQAQDVATLKSDLVTRNFIQQNNLLPILYAKRWDAGTKRWRDSDPRHIPTLWKANRFFQNTVRTVTEDNKSGLIRVTVTWTDPYLAAQWANGLVDMTNAYLRSKAIVEANRNIAYLQQRAATTSVVEVKQGIYLLMQEEIGDAMIAQGKSEYALQVIDPAFPPETPYSPQKLLWALGGFITGLLLSLGFVVFRAGWTATA
jgi:uncharacterized protein involved in exopolysaccharide biosynthesis